MGKHSSLFDLFFRDEEKEIMTLTPAVDVIQLFALLLAKKPNKQQRLSLRFNNSQV
jgi:hypothetical protein